MKTWVALNDWQIPFHDKPVLDLAIRFIERLQPHGVILNGDIVDCYALSKFTKNPDGPASLDREIKLAAHYMERLVDCVPIRIWHGGNHEDRLRRHVWDNPKVFGVVESTPSKYRFPALFNLQQYGFTWKEYGQGTWLGKLFVTHGSLVKKHSGETARAHYLKYGVPIFVGHSHRGGSYFHTDMGGPAVAYENFCLCRLDPEYDHSPDWQHGLSTIHVDDKKTKFFHVEQIPILGRRLLIYGGEMFE